MNSVSIGSSDLGTPDNSGKSEVYSGGTNKLNPSGGEVEYLSTGGPKELNSDKYLAATVPLNPADKEYTAIMRRLAQFFSR